jgi:hypothetical protein
MFKTQLFYVICDGTGADYDASNLSEAIKKGNKFIAEDGAEEVVIYKAIKVITRSKEPVIADVKEKDLE